MVPVYGGSTETQVYTHLMNMGFNKAVSVGILANIYKESGFNHQSIGDSGTSYGLCQWHDTSTGSGRWTALKRYCSRNNLNPTTVKGQLAYLSYELSNSYKELLSILKSLPDTGQGCWDAAAQWCARFEIPAGYGYWSNGELILGSTSRARGDFARGTYWSAYSNVSIKIVTPPNKGDLIVQEAKKHLGKPYVWGAYGPNQFDCSGFIYYVYKQAINYNWNRTTAYYQYKDYGRSVSDYRAGDLIFFANTYETGNNPNISHVGIATGNGKEFIHASSSTGVTIDKITERNYYKSHFWGVKRLVNDSETGFSDGESTSVEEVSASLTFAALGDYREELEAAITRIEDQNNNLPTNARLPQKYGYLVDLVNGGEFKFYVPEYEKSVSANWDDQSIIGRSGSIKGYNSTNSLSIPITLTLVAGAGLYETARGTTNDRVQDLHDDIDFLQSLNYPDYGNAIVLPPPVVLLYLGPTMKMKGVVHDFRVNFKKPYDVNMRPMIAEVSFTVTHVTDNPPDYKDIRNHNMEGAVSRLANNLGSTNEIVIEAERPVPVPEPPAYIHDRNKQRYINPN